MTKCRVENPDLPAIQAVDRVATIPVTKARGAKRTMSTIRLGANAAKIPIEIPPEARLPKPQRAYEAMS